MTPLHRRTCSIVPFDDEAEAVRLANDTPYGLSGAIYTEVKNVFVDIS